jgi:hypothetical protein
MAKHVGLTRGSSCFKFVELEMPIRANSTQLELDVTSTWLTIAIFGYTLVAL